MPGKRRLFPGVWSGAPRDSCDTVKAMEFSAGSGQHVRAEILPSATVPAGTAEPPWPTPAECYLAELASIGKEWSIGSFEAGTVELDTAAIVAAVAEALPVGTR